MYIDLVRKTVCVVSVLPERDIFIQGPHRRIFMQMAGACASDADVHVQGVSPSIQLKDSWP